MRASVLPEVGSTLRCQLDNPAGGEAIEMIGRVVWAHESGPHVGEFGIRFTHSVRRRPDTNRGADSTLGSYDRHSAHRKLAARRRGLFDRGRGPVRERHRALGRTAPPFPGDWERGDERGHQPARAPRSGRAQDGRSDPEAGVEHRLRGREHASERPLSADGGDRDTLPEEAPSGVQASRPDREERMHDTPRIVRYDPGEEDRKSETAERPAARVREVGDGSAGEHRRRSAHAQ